MPALTNSWDNIRTWWQTATPATRAAATGAALLLIVALIAAISLSASPDYTAAFTGVSGKDPDAIMKVLATHNIQAKYDADHGTISVPSKDKSNAIMYVNAEASLSKNADIPGIEALDKIGIGTDHDIEMEKIRAANEGELERILMELDPVQSASVRVSGGTDSSLFGNDTPPHASVVLTLKPSQALDDEQVKGVVMTVANSFTGLTAGNVTLSDQTGTQLWHGDGPGGTGVDPLVREDTRVAELWQNKLQSLLDGTLGQNKARVTVDAEMDNDQTQVDSTDHVPATADGSAGTPISEHEVTEKYSGGGAPPAGGVAGSGSNIAPSYTAGAGGSGGAYTKSETTTNLEVNTRHTITQKAPSLKKLSVAAIVDTSIPADVVGSIQKTLNGAIGAVPGDSVHLVTVQQIPFDTSAARQAEAQLKALQSQQLMSTVLKAVAAVAVAGVLLFLLTRSGRPAAPQLALAGAGANIGLLDPTALPPQVEEAALEERPLRIEDVLAEMPEISPSSRPRRRPHAPAIEEQPDLKLESVQEMISASPQSVALLLKGWMYEDSMAA